jgi:hypothetical protein
VNLLPVAQAIPAQPPAHGLLASANEATDLPAEPSVPGQDRWGLGFTVQPENCTQAVPWDPDCGVWPTSGGDNVLDQKTAKEDAPTNQESYDVSPVVLVTSYACETKGFLSIDYSGRARRQLEASTSKAMEYELWTGDLKATNPNLQTGATVLESGAAVTPADALALLSQALSNCGAGGRGTIHAPTVFAERLLSVAPGAVKEAGNKLVSVNRGDTIVSGSGYPGTGPAGIAPPAGHTYVYATGPVNYRLGPPLVYPETFREAMNKTTNTIEYYAEREVAMNFDPCCHFVILVDIRESDGGSGGGGGGDVPTIATATLSNVAAAAISTSLLAAGAYRKGVLVFNDADEALLLKYGATASATSYTVKIAAGGYWEMPWPVFTGALDGIWENAPTGAARITELV